MRRAYERVPHYRGSSMPRASGPSDLKALDDLARFPFTTKEDLRETYPFGMFAVPMAEIVRIHASSGTTGKPTVVGYTQSDIETWARPDGAVVPRRGWTAERYGPQRLWLRPLHRRARLSLWRGTARRGGGAGERRRRRSGRCGSSRIFAPRIITATPSYLLTIADEFERQGIDPRTSSLRLAHLRRRAVERSDARRDRGGGSDSSA